MADRLLTNPSDRDGKLNAILYMLHIVLVEIRAADDKERVRVYADVVHNVPMMIRSGRHSSQIVDEIVLKAKRHKVAPYFEKLLQNGENA